MGRGAWRRALAAWVAAWVLAVTGLREAAAGHRGAWSAPFAEGGPGTRLDDPETAERYPAAVHMAVLPDGRVLYWNGLEGTEDAQPVYPINAKHWARNARARILDLRSGRPRWTVPEPEDGGAGDLFCADAKFLADGRLLIAGGSWYHDDPDLGAVGVLEVDGLAHSRVFDPETGRFRVTRPMNYPRWYPSLVTLPDGRVLALSGTPRLLKNTVVVVREPEVFDPGREAWRGLGRHAERSLPLYPRVHLLPNGRVLFTAAGQWGPALASASDELAWSTLAWFDPRRGRWEELGPPALGVGRNGAFSVLLPLEPPYTRARLLVGGGTLGSSRSTGLATPWTEWVDVDLRTGRVQVRLGPTLGRPRWFGTPVLLADGTVAIFSGSDVDATVTPGLERGVRTPEWIDPKTGEVRDLAPAARDRTYHNTAALLPDGSVLVGGHAPIPFLYARHEDSAHRMAGTAPNYRDPSFEIFRPPYLFRGPRPEIRGAPRRVRYGSTLRVWTPDAARVRSALLIRLPSTTHTIDADMRAVYLRIARRGDRSVDLVAPPHGAVAPPGPYYLFLHAASPDGPVPSRAAVVWLVP